MLAGFVGQQLEQELPQLDGSAALVAGKNVGWDQGLGLIGVLEKND